SRQRSRIGSAEELRRLLAHRPQDFLDAGADGNDVPKREGRRDQRDDFAICRFIKAPHHRQWICFQIIRAVVLGVQLFQNAPALSRSHPTNNRRSSATDSRNVAKAPVSTSREVRSTPPRFTSSSGAAEPPPRRKSRYCSRISADSRIRRENTCAAQKPVAYLYT